MLRCRLAMRAERRGAWMVGGSEITDDVVILNGGVDAGGLPAAGRLAAGALSNELDTVVLRSRASSVALVVECGIVDRCVDFRFFVDCKDELC